MSLWNAHSVAACLQRIAPDRVSSAAAVMAGQHAIATQCRTSPPPRFILVTTTNVLVMASQFETGPGGHDCLQLVELWLAHYGYELRADTADRTAAAGQARGCLRMQERILHGLNMTLPTRADGREVDPDDMLNELKVWLSEHVYSTATNQSLTAIQEDALMGLHPSSYIGCSITAIGFDDIERNETASQLVSQVLAESNIVSYEPIRVDSPRQGTQWSDRPECRGSDEIHVASSSVTVILLSQSAAGLGSLAEMSARYRVPILLIDDAEQITPMISGLDAGLVTRVPLRGDLEETVREYIRRNWAQLVAHARRLRTDRQRWRREIDSLVERIDTLRDDALTVPPLVGMSKRRFHSLLTHEVLWGGATHTEMNELRSLLSGEPKPLKSEQLKALIFAQVECGWSAETVRQLERVGRDALAADVAQRANADQPAYWIELHERHVR